MSPPDAPLLSEQDPPSPGELEVLRSLAAGFTDEAVMRKLELSRRTLQRHLKAGMRKLEARSRFQAGFKLALSGWIRANDVKFPPAGGAGPERSTTNPPGVGAGIPEPLERARPNSTKEEDR
ncbi:MAG: response regulator transcription factor [Actinomycetota bacterium]